MLRGDIFNLMCVCEQSGVTPFSLAIGDFNKDDFIPGNPTTVGNFPGVKLGNMYRAYIEYFDADGGQRNTGVELSSFSTPMIQASPPLVRYLVS